MEQKEAIDLTQRILNELESCRFIDIEQLHDDHNSAEGEQRFPGLLDIPEEKLRMLVLRGWLNGEIKGGPNSNAKIHGGASYVIVGPGQLWLAYEQSSLTIGIANRANSRSWLAIGV